MYKPPPTKPSEPPSYKPARLEADEFLTIPGSGMAFQVSAIVAIDVTEKDTGWVVTVHLHEGGQFTYRRYSLEGVTKALEYIERRMPGVDADLLLKEASYKRVAS